MGGSILLVLAAGEEGERVKGLDRGAGNLLSEAHIVLTRGSTPSSLTLHIVPYGGDASIGREGESTGTGTGTGTGMETRERARTRKREEELVLPTIGQLVSQLDSLPLVSYDVAVCRVPKVSRLLQRHIPIVYDGNVWGGGDEDTESSVSGRFPEQVPPELTHHHSFLPLTNKLAVKVRSSSSNEIFHWDWRQRELLFWLRDRATLVEEREGGGGSLRMSLAEGLPSFMCSPVILRLWEDDKGEAERESKSTPTSVPGRAFNTGGTHRVVKFVTTADETMGPAFIYGIVNGVRSNEISLVEPAFTDLFLKYHHQRRHNVKSKMMGPIRTPPLKRTLSTGGATMPESSMVPAWADPTISLSQWTPPSLETFPPSLSSLARTSYSQPPPLSAKSASTSAALASASASTLTSASAASLKMHNKNMLKKLMLLSLRHVGIDKNHEEFASIWKHLYCACLFALRKELAAVRIQQNELFAVIRSNMNFLNIK